EFTRYAPDVSIDRLELVQVVQTEAGEVPLIARKPTILRVFVKQRGHLSNPISGITANLRVFRGDVEVASFPAIAGSSPKSIQASEKPDRGLEDQSLNYVLPEEWRDTGSFRYEVELQLPLNRSEGPKSNNKDSITKSYRDGYGVNLATIKVCVDGVCPEGGLSEGLNYLRRTTSSKLMAISMGSLRFPNDLLSYGFLSSYLQGDLYDRDIRLLLLARLEKLKLEFRVYDLLIGVLPRIPSRTVGGQTQTVPDDESRAGDQGLGVLFAQERGPLRQHKIAHHVGRMLGLTPAECRFPYPSVTGEPGFDAEDGKFYPPGTPDLMTNCLGAWLSKAEYERFESGLRKIHEVRLTASPAPAASAKAAPRGADSAERHILVSGIVTRDGTGSTLEPAHQLVPGLPMSADAPSGNHCLEFYGDGPLTRHCFDLRFTDSEGLPLNLAVFNKVILFPETATRLALLRGGQELASISGATAPVLEFLSPASGSRLQGTQTIRWSGSDAAGAGLSYTLLYSSDEGGLWRPLLISGSSPEFSIDAAALAGRRVHFKVRASNGLRSAEIVAGPFEIAHNPRLAPLPPVEDFGNLQTSLARTRQIRVENIGVGSLGLRSVTSDSPHFEIRNRPEYVPAGESEWLEVAFMPKAAGTQHSTLTLETDDPANPRLTISLTGTGFTAPIANIAAAPAQLDFGTVASGQTKDLEIVIGNSGNADLNVASLAFSSAVFSA
ncbi:MAG: choice-of-anchor D domain-containing protein, partial [Acidimicrobiia bacterium]|nr:choice-of-anchor D domain-containing protein [Acidimicrobiia bacterium]